MKIKTISALLLGTTFFVASNSFAAQEFVANTSSGYDLTPGKTEIIKGNNLIGSKKLNCIVRTHNQEQNSSLMIKAQELNVVINHSILLPQGESVSLPVSAGQKIAFELDVRARLAITNEGSRLINLKCD